MKTRHTRLFASVSAAALIGMTALTPMATAQDAGDTVEETTTPETGTTTNSNTPWEMNWYYNQLQDLVGGLGNINYDNTTGDLQGLLDEIDRLRDAGETPKTGLTQLLSTLIDYLGAGSHVPPTNAVYDSEGKLFPRYEFYYPDNSDEIESESQRYEWVDPVDVAENSEGEDARYVAVLNEGGSVNHYTDTLNNNHPVNSDGEPVERGVEDSGWVPVDTEGKVYDRTDNDWVDEDVVDERMAELTALGEPMFVDSLNNDTIVGENGYPIAGENEWLNPDTNYIPPPREEGGQTGEEDSNGDVVEGDPEESTPEREQDVIEETEPGVLPDGLTPVEGQDDLYEDGEGNYYQYDGDGNYGRVDEDNRPLDEDDNLVDTVEDETPGNGNGTGDNPAPGTGSSLFEGLDVTIDGDRIEVSFPVDLAGNPHTLTASYDAQNGFNVTLTPGNESSTGGGSSNNGGGSSNNGSSNGDTDQDDDSTVISNPTVTPVYIDADGNTHPAEHDEDGNIVPPENLDDGTYRLGFQIQGENGEPVIVGTDYSVKVGDGAMTEADNDEGGGVVQVDNETDADDEDEDDNGNGNGGSGNDPNTASFKPAVTNLESLGAGGGGTDVGGDGTDSDGRVMQNAANDDDSTSSNRSNSRDIDDAGTPPGGQGGGPATTSAYDDNTQTHASGQENLAVTGTNTNVLMAAVGSLLLAAAGVFFVGRRKGWV